MVDFCDTHICMELVFFCGCIFAYFEKHVYLSYLTPESLCDVQVLYVCCYDFNAFLGYVLP
jgi:hypothetical protein